MLKVEPIGNEFHVVEYNENGVEIKSKQFKTYLFAKNAMERLNEQKNNWIDAFPLIKELEKFTADIIAKVKIHRSVAITDTKCGTIFIEYWNNVFAMKFGDKHLVTDNELMVFDVLKGQHKFTIQNTPIEKK